MMADFLGRKKLVDVATICDRYQNQDDNRHRKAKLIIEEDVSEV